MVETNDKEQEARYVAREILKLIEQDFEPGEIAVLYRSHSHSLDLQIELSKSQIDFRILSGIRFYRDCTCQRHFGVSEDLSQST